MPIGAARSNTVGKKFDYKIDAYTAINNGLGSNQVVLYDLNESTNQFDPQALGSGGTVFPEAPYTTSIGRPAMETDSSGNKWWAVRDSGSKAFIYKMASGTSDWTYITTISHGGGTTYSCAWNPDATKLFFATSSGSRLHGYSRSGNTFTKDQTFSNLPTSTCYDVEVSPDGQKLALAWNSAVPWVYDWTGSTWQRRTWYNSAPDGSGAYVSTRSYSCGWSKNSDKVVFGSYASPYFRVYTLGYIQNNLGLYAHSNPSTGASNQALALSWNPSYDVFTSANVNGFDVFYPSSNYTVVKSGSTVSSVGNPYGTAWVDYQTFVAACNSTTIQSWEFLPSSYSFISIDTDEVASLGNNYGLSTTGNVIEVEGQSFPYHQGYTISGGVLTPFGTVSVNPNPSGTWFSKQLVGKDKIVFSGQSTTLPSAYQWDGTTSGSYNTLFTNSGDDYMYGAVYLKDNKFALLEINPSTNDYVPQMATLSSSSLSIDTNLTGTTTSVGVGASGYYKIATSGDGNHWAVGPNGYQAPFKGAVFMDYDSSTGKYEQSSFPQGYPTQPMEYGHGMNYDGSVYWHADYSGGLDIYKRSGSTWSFYKRLTASDFGQQQWSGYPLINNRGDVIYIYWYGTIYAAVDNGNATYTISTCSNPPSTSAGSYGWAAQMEPNNDKAMWAYDPTNGWKRVPLTSQTAFSTTYDSYPVSEYGAYSYENSYYYYDTKHHYKKT